MRVCEAQFLSKAQPVSTVSPHCAILRTCRWQDAPAAVLLTRAGPCTEAWRAAGLDTCHVSASRKQRASESFMVTVACADKLNYRDTEH